MFDLSVSRRNFVKIAGAAAAGSAVPIGTALADESAVSMTPGTYVGTGKGRAGTLSVAVTVTENTIESVEFLGSEARSAQVLEDAKVDPTYPPDPIDPERNYPTACQNDTQQVLDTVVERLGGRIVDAQSLAVDLVAGATMSSLGYLAAVRDALAQAGAGDAFESAPIQQDSSEGQQDLGAFDVIVVGGGGSGTMAAAAATSTGARVLLIEKTARIGGCAAMSSGGHFTNSQLQVAAGLGTDEPDPLFLDAVNMAQQQPKAIVLKQFLEHGGEVVDFMANVGGFELIPGPDTVVYAQNSLLYPNVSDAWKGLAATIDTVLLETSVTALLTDADGAVCGIEATGRDGSSYVASASAVVVATGGFLGNPDLMTKYNYAPRQVTYGMSQDTGNVLQMEWDLGARKYHVGGTCSHITQTTGWLDEVDDYARMIPYTLHVTPSFLRVNDRGERFSSENAMSTAGMNGTGNYINAQGRYFYVVISQDQMNVLATEGLAGVNMVAPPFTPNFDFFPLPVGYAMESIGDVMEKTVAAGDAFKGDTFEELAMAAGFDPETFVRHAGRYEAACKAGFDDLHFKEPEYLVPMGSGPYYALRCEACPYSTIGGVEVDERMRVLSVDGRPIPGLFSAGAESSGALFSGAAYSNVAGVCFGWAVYSGYAAGLSAAGHPIV